MTSEIKIYSTTKIRKDQNFLFDDIEAYLSDKVALDIPEAQWVRNGRRIEVKLSLSQNYFSENSSGDSGGRDYCSVRNSDEARTYYYFVDSYLQRSPNTLQLSLNLDVLNTFGKEYDFTSRTLIQREHKDRYKLYNSERPTLTDIDKDISLEILHSKTDEGMNFKLFRKSSREIEDIYSSDAGIQKKFSSSKFYLVYFTFNKLTAAENKYYEDGNINSDEIQAFDGMPAVALVSSSSDLFYGAPEGSTFVNAYGLSFSNLNRIAANIVKVIECPYLPLLKSRLKYISGPVAHFEIINESYADKWYFLSDSQICKGHLVNRIWATFDLASVSFFENLTADSDLQNKFVLKTLFDNVNDFVTERRNTNGLDPKCDTSSFKYIKYSYDSFNWVLKTEDYSNLKADAALDTLVVISYQQSSSLSSDLLFRFLALDLTYTPETDYGEYMLCSRNNEVTLYSSDYLNYMRLGYNYDKKTASRNITSAWLGNASAWVASAAGIIAGLASQNPTITMAGITGLAGSIGSTINTGIKTASNLNNLQQQLDTFRMQSFDVADIDDLSLFERYGKNKLWRYEYSISDEDMTLVDSLFYYSGYAANYFGVPNLNSRYWFNFLQAKSDIIPIGNAVILYEFREDIVQKYAEGVTVIHKGRNGMTILDYDYDLENWEMSILPEGIRS